MSRFFRDTHSSSSSSSDGELLDSDEEASPLTHLSSQNNDNSRPGHASDEEANGDDLGRALAALAAPTSDLSPGHRDLLLHALLEERCIAQAREHLADISDSDRVQAFARSRYQSLCEQLTTYGMIAPGFNADSFQSTRQRYRDGLDVLTSHLSQSTRIRSTRPGTRRMLTDGQGAESLITNIETIQLSPNLQALASPILERQFFESGFRLPSYNTALSGPSSPSAVFGVTRYQRDFDEVCMLGKGGYGIVYHCRHRLDGLSYAVKKIPLSNARLGKIRERGKEGVNELLLELTTLAKLEHPNIVRYFGGWIEMTTLGVPDALEGASQGGATPVGHRSGASMSDFETGVVPNRLIEMPDNNFITFERSNSSQPASSTETCESDARDSDDTNTLHRLSTRDTQPTVSDDDEIESISRSASDILDRSTLSNYMQDTAPCLALHIQMGLYPLTLADYLMPLTIEESQDQLRHCFHLEPAVQILLALVDGIQYLHSQGVVHRDLKPANIFLAPQARSNNLADSIKCAQCKSQSRDGNVALKVRIGDFGLVAAMAQSEDEGLASPVGTELYRPSFLPSRTGIESLDWFALGVIAFELLWPFRTRMERHETLLLLKSCRFPDDFGLRLGKSSDKVKASIDALLSAKGTVDAASFKRKLEALLK